ncbi:unnamed protein product, partial [Adineta ricciae]
MSHNISMEPYCPQVTAKENTITNLTDTRINKIYVYEVWFHVLHLNNMIPVPERTGVDRTRRHCSVKTIRGT